MIRCVFQGRTGNLLLQNIALSIMSKKFDMKASYYEIPQANLLGFTLVQRERVIESPAMKFFDADLMSLLSKESIDYGIQYDGYFQVKEFVLAYREDILSHFHLAYENPDNNDVFVHVRLDDAQQHNPGLEYYRTALKSLNYDRGFISSDSPSHPTIQRLTAEFGLVPMNGSPIELINFAKNFKHLVLSKGTFSWWMGFLSQGNVIYAVGDPQWYGDIFVFDSWHSIDIKNM